MSGVGGGVTGGFGMGLPTQTQQHPIGGSVPMGMAQQMMAAGGGGDPMVFMESCAAKAVLGGAMGGVMGMAMGEFVLAVRVNECLS